MKPPKRPREDRVVDVRYMNHRVNLMMQMNALHDELKAIVTEFVRSAEDPIEALGTVDEFLSPGIQEHLRNVSWSSSSSSRASSIGSEGNDEAQEGGPSRMGTEEERGGLVAFKTRKKEARHQSYKIR
jgi:hypothetical protein